MSKYKPAIINLLSENPQSTNEILNKLEKQSKKVINWHVVYRILAELASQNKARKIKTKAGFFWCKR